MAANADLLSAAEINLRELAEDVVRRAMKSGATAAEAIVRDGTEFSTVVRMGEVETLKEAGSRGMGLRVFVGKRVASTYSSDFSEDGISHLVNGALALAKVTSEDPFVALPDPSELGSIPGDLQLYSDDVYSLPPAERIEYARRAEKAALEFDPRMKNSDGGSFDASSGRKVLANSLGFAGEYRRSYCALSAAPIAQAEDGRMQRDYWYTVARRLGKLESPESVGHKAAQRTLRRLGGRKISSTKVPIVLEQTVAGSILGNIFEAASGDSIYRQSSFLVGKLGQKVAGDNVNVIDDGTIPGGFGTTPFDGDGVPTRRTVVIESGILQSYLLNTYTARKLSLKTTGNAARGLAGNPGIGAGNFFLNPGTRTPQQIIAEIKRGLFVTEFLGFGVNLVTGDFSRGASGMWIENGELTFPVEEITVAGNLKDMLNNISEIGSDLEFRGSVACPTLRIDGMTIAGE